MSCSHAFCTVCFDKQIEVCHTGNMAVDAEGAPVATMNIIQCIVCKLCSLLPPKDAGVKIILQDEDEDEEFDTKYNYKGQLLCTCCGRGGTAVAKCHDCVCYICSACVKAHKDLYSFQSHQVITTVILLYSFYHTSMVPLS